MQLDCVKEVGSSFGAEIEVSGEKVADRMEVVQSAKSDSAQKSDGSAEQDEKPDDSVATNESSKEEGDATVTLSEAAEICGVSKETVRSWIEEEKLKAVEIGDDYRISKKELQKTWKELGGGDLF